MSGDNPAFGGAPAHAESIANDVVCRKCGYNLRGLPQNGHCPECGTPIGVSLHGYLLRFSDPRWLLTLRTGINAILVSVGIALLAAIVQAFSRGRGGVLHTLVSWAGSIVALAGVWLLTMPDPNGLGEQEYGNARKLARVGAIAGLAGSLLSGIGALSGAASSGTAHHQPTWDVSVRGLVELLARAGCCRK